MAKNARRESDVKIRFIKFVNPAISVYLRYFFNRRTFERIYPEFLKIAEVILLYKERQP